MYNWDPKSFISTASKLYNINSENFKSTHLKKVAQQEAKSLILEKIPV